MDKFYLKKIKEKIKTLGRGQSLEGGFTEGNGPDSGYNTVSLAYLALYYKRSGDKSVLPILKKAVDFSSYFLYPDGFTGGGFNSRQAGMLFPLGFIILSNELGLARRLALKSLDSLIEKMNGLLTLNNMRRCITLHKILRSYLTASGKDLNTAVNLPTEEKGRFTKYMKQSGIVVVKTPFYYLVIGTKKGCIGAIYSYRMGNTFYMSSPNGCDCLGGILGVTHEGLLVSNISCTSVGTEVIIGKESMLTKLDLPLIDPKTERRWMKDRLIDKPPLLYVYHIGSELGFRHAMLSTYKRFNKERKRQRQKPVLRLIREIGWTDNTIIVLNDVVFLKPCDYKELYLGETFIVHEGLSEIRKYGTAVKYLLDEKKAMIMSAKGKNIEIKSGEPASLRFNKAQPMIARIHLNKKAKKVRVCYKLKLE